MLRFALVHGAAESAALARVAPRLQSFGISAVVEPTPAAAAMTARELNVKLAATSIDELHQQHDAEFDAWLSPTSSGWLLVPHANRPIQLQPALWKNHADGWMWGNTSRFLPSVRAVQSSLSSGQLGEPGLVRIHHWQTTESGDAAMALLPQFDLACALVGSPPVVLFAQSRPNGTEKGDLNYVQVHLGFAKDQMALIDCSTSLGGGDEYYSLSVIGSRGAAYSDDHHNRQLRFGGAQAMAIRTPEGDLALLAMLEEYLTATSNARPPACGVKDWLQAWQLLEATQISLRTGQSVSLDLRES